VAIFLLHRDEAEMGYLPPVCMRCGAPATCQRRKHFETSSDIQAAKTWVLAPLCNAHRHHWFGRDLIVIFTPIAFLVLPVLAGIAGLFPGGRQGSMSMGPVLAYLGIVFVGWCCLAAYLHFTSIHAKEITKHTLILAGLAPEFVQGLRQLRESPSAAVPLRLSAGAQRNNQVRLRAKEMQGDLPAVCMRCGAPATTWIDREFRASRNGAAVLGFLSVLLGVGRVTWSSDSGWPRVQAPLCARHRNHWKWRERAVGFAILSLIALATAGFIWLPLEWFGFMVGFCFFGFLAWLILAMVLQETSITPTELHQDVITLKNVSAEFVAGLGRRRGQGPSPL